MKRGGKRTSAAEPGWRETLDRVPVPMYLEDVTAVTRSIKTVLDEGVTDFRAWLDGHPEFLHKALARIRLLDVNEAAVHLNAAADREDLLTSLERLFLPETLANIKDFLVALAEGRETYAGEGKYQTLDGREYFTWNQARLPGLTDNPALVLMSTTDITLQKISRLRLEESEGRYRHLVESVRDVIACLDLDGTLRFVNRAGADLTGWQPDELVGRNWRDILPAARAGDLDHRAALRADGFDDLMVYETVLRTRDGREVPVEVSSTVMPAGHGPGAGPQLIAMARDISRRKSLERSRREMEARLLTSQKLESLGVMTGGIAHYFNNILATIVGNAELLQLNQPPGASDRRLLSAILTAAAEGADFCDQMQAYAGPGGKAGARLDVSRAVTEMTPLLRVSTRRRAELVLQLDPDLPQVGFGDAQFRQVVMNLVANAVEAMPATGGEIVVRTGFRDFSAGELAAGQCLPTLPPGRYVFCEVGDSGQGMEAEIVPRIFEPFFTTRPDHGGLGLYAAMGLVKGRGGAFLVDTGPGRGSTLRMILPPVPAAGPRARSRKAPDTLDLDLAGRTVLIVAEDPAQRTMSEGMVRRLGCKVLSTGSGFDAVHIFGQRHEEIDAVLLDLTMTLLDGAETCRRLRVIRPHLPVVFSTGLKEGLVTEITAEFERCGVAHKPFTLVQLRTRLAEVLGAGA